MFTYETWWETWHDLCQILPSTSALLENLPKYGTKFLK